PPPSPPPPPPPPVTGVTRVSVCCGPLGVATSGNVALVSQDQGAALARFDLTTDSVTASIPVGGVPAYLAFNDIGSTAYVANFGNHNVGIIDVATNAQTDVIAVNGSPLPIAVTRNGGTAFVTTDANRFYKIDVPSKTVVDSLDLPATSHHLLNLNDTLVYIATRDGGSVLEVNQLTMTVLRTFVLGGRPQGMAVATNRTELYVANEIRTFCRSSTCRAAPSPAYRFPAAERASRWAQMANCISVRCSPDSSRLWIR